MCTVAVTWHEFQHNDKFLVSYIKFSNHGFSTNCDITLYFASIKHTVNNTFKNIVKKRRKGKKQRSCLVVITGSLPCLLAVGSGEICLNP